MNKEVLIDYNLCFIEELAFILKVRSISDVYISTTKGMILFNSSYEFNKNFDIRPDKCITRKENYKPISHERKHRSPKYDFSKCALVIERIHFDQVAFIPEMQG